MRKYTGLWEFLRQSGQPRLTLSFAEIGEIAGAPMNHAFLTAKKELAAYGYEVKKISMKEQTVLFERKN